VLINYKLGLLNPSDRKWVQQLQDMYNMTERICSRHNKKTYWFAGNDKNSNQFTYDGRAPSFSKQHYRLICAKDLKIAIKLFYNRFPSGFESDIGRPDSYISGNQKFTLRSSDFDHVNLSSSSSTTNAIISKDITFTIKDKKEQCEAIGFTPKTEKFADCVLRLVELDVKNQQQNQIELAVSQGNQQVADELRKQRNDRGSEYLMNLGMQLLSNDAPASMPSTNNCRVNVYRNNAIECF